MTLFRSFLEALRGLFISPARAATLATVSAYIIASGFDLSNRSVETLSLVGPEISTVAECAAQKPIYLNGQKITFTVYHGQRTDAEHQEMLAKGVSWVNRSKHQDGLAIDVLARVNGKDTWDHLAYYPIAEAFYACGKEKGIPITWGCEWKVKDCVHFEVKR